MVGLTSMALWSALLCSRLVTSGYQPIWSQSAWVNFNDTGQGKTFPDYISNSAPCSLSNGASYFGNELNFDAVPQKIITGAADQIFLLNQALECQDSYLWNSTDTNFFDCTQAGIEDSACRNHIRVYKRLPSQPSILLVCGTQGGFSPQCRTFNMSNNIFAPTMSTSSIVPASDGLISSYPEFNWFGEFIESSGGVGGPDKFFSSGYYRGNRQLGRDLNITYHSVSYAPDSGTLTLNKEFSTKDDIYWLNLPVTLVDYYRADYGSPTTSLYQFYFIFLREVLVGINGLEVIYSRVARICRNDPGINGHFSTYMKARIFCEREVPPGRQFNGAVDYHYNEIQSLVFNGEGRIGDGGTWVKMMYGAFSGPTIGPPGTAICAYRADDSTTTGGTGFNRGIFDIFREDLTVVMPNGMTAERENTYVECRSGGRTMNFNSVLSVQDISQIGEDPLVVFDGLIVTKMAFDQVCVVTPSNPQQCQNQDVLFLGTDTGKILKVVFSGSTTYDPVIAEEITLDPDGDDAVKELHIVNVDTSNERYLYAATNLRVYRLPLQRCSRLQGCNECISSRDPYCVWNNSTSQAGCQAAPLMVSGSSTVAVPTNIWQNIHTGSVPECQATPNCEVTVMAISADMITCEAECSNAVSVTFSSDVPGNDSVKVCGEESTSPTIAGSTGCVVFAGTIGLHNYVCTVEAMPISGSTVNFTNSTTTPAGPPICIAKQDVIHFSGQRDVTVCVNLNILTDRFENYGFEVVNLNGNRSQMFSDNSCLRIENLIPGSEETYTVMVFSSIPSSCVPVSIDVKLLEDNPGPVENLRLIPSNTSIAISWSPPSVGNGIISGYAIYLEDTVVSNCAILNGSFRSYNVEGLRPYSEYTIDVKACTAAGEGSSESMTILTLCGTPSGVQNLVIVAGQNFHSLNVMWDLPLQLNGNSSSIQYMVNYTCYHPSIPIVSWRRAQISRLTIDDLLPLTHCCVSVYAENICNFMIHSGPVVSVCGHTTDGKPPRVQNLRAIAVSDHSFYVVWEPPVNYTRPGLRYLVGIGGQNNNIVVWDQTYYFINTDLVPNTSYTVEVRAISTVDMSEPNHVTATTKPQFPTPPRNVRFSSDGDGNVTVLEWDAVPGVSHYVVFWQCNEFTGNSTSETTFAIIDALEYPYAWCTARVQSVNEFGVSDLSNASSIVTPLIAPPQPICFLIDNRGSSAVFSFTVTDPFSLHQLQVDWKLSATSGTIELSDESIFDNSTLVIPVRRNTEYVFSLRLCNTKGCGDYCQSIMFTTNTNPPQAPTHLDVETPTSSVAVLSWNPPSNENPENVRYTFEVTSSCQSGNIRREGLIEAIVRLENLCNGKTYSFVVQATDITNNVTGPLSQPYTFRTSEGTPSLPRNVQLVLGEKMLTIHWTEPLTANGNLTHYEVLWKATNINNCDKVYELCHLDNVQCNFTNTSSSDYNVTFYVDTAVIEFILVCVRAYTSAGGSEWGSFYNGTIKTGALINVEEDCGGLIVVAVITSCAIISSVIMAIVLAMVIYKTRDSAVCVAGTQNLNSITSQSTKSLISQNGK